MNTFKRKALFTVVLAGLAVATLPGCESFGAPRMTPEQLTAAAKDKSASVGCGSYDSPLVDGAVMLVTIDEKVIRNGRLLVKCGSNSVDYSNAASPYQVTTP